jgi:adenine-specific DNA-methyltransferase
MLGKIARLERARLAAQSALDAASSRSERNRLGQFATPTALARDVLRYATQLLTEPQPIHFLDPALGTGSFYSALRAVVPPDRVAAALGFELDPQCGTSARRLWAGEGLALRQEDFTRADPEARFNLIICNPPYVRHHHLPDGVKRRLQLRTRLASGMRLNGLAGLYGHFLGVAHPWLAEHGVAGWLVPSEFMDVNYGRAVKRYLLDRVTLLHIHRFDPRDVQFADALVSSAVVWLRNAPCPKDHEVSFTFGGSLLAPRIRRDVPLGALTLEGKWTRLAANAVRGMGAIARPRVRTRHRSVAGAPAGNGRMVGLPGESVPALSTFFRITRGIATGDNGFFILPERRIAELGLPKEVFTAILPSPRYLPADEVKPRKDGTPDIDQRLFLLDVRLSEEEVRQRYPRLAAYLAQGEARGVSARYLCKHRAPWYRQEHRPPPPIVCTYLGRQLGKRCSPFRFILNGSEATVGNVYLAMYPAASLTNLLARDDSVLRRIWTILNRLTPDRLLEQGRVYGGGLYKLEPRELANVRAPEITALLFTPEHPMPQRDQRNSRALREMAWSRLGDGTGHDLCVPRVRPGSLARR